MATVMVPHHASNAAKVIPLHRRPGLQQAATLAQQIDDLAELRALLRQATATERELTGSVLTELAALRVSRFEGTDAVAVLEHRTCLKPDPELFVEALGKAAYAALTVSVSKARELIGEQNLQAISEATTTPALRVEARKAEVA